jgi:dihydrodipicolinate synthase/N-acetylneuraminate lyase
LIAQPRSPSSQVPRRHAKPGDAVYGRFSTFERLLDFHVRTGATAISWPHHKGESLSLTIAERELFAEAAVRVVNGRIPVTIHVSALAVEDTMELARHAQKIGADGILAITPYFWTPSLPAIEAYFVRLCSAIELPVLSHNSPSYLAGVEITGALMSRLIERLPNFAGAIGATGMFAPLAAIAPRMVRELYDLCRAEKLFEARPVQEQLAALRQSIKRGGVTGLKPRCA